MMMITDYKLPVAISFVKEGVWHYHMRITFDMNHDLDFDPNGIGTKNCNIFGLPFEKDEAQVVILPVPWEVTVSYRPGTAKAPQAVFDASLQVDLYDPEIKDVWKKGIYMEKADKKLVTKNDFLRKKSAKIIEHLENDGDTNDPKIRALQHEVNEGCADLNEWVEKASTNLLKAGKIVGVLGGEHSVPLGLMRALAKIHSSFGILHIDAHADLRHAYEGFEFSHASVMNNALKIKEVKKLVQVGVRDFCEEEAETIKKSNGRIRSFLDREMNKARFNGKTWHQICVEIIKELPSDVYVSFDADGLDPSLCPNTGTPVPGGLQFEEAFYLLSEVVKSGRKIIGFDLCEVSPSKNSEIDAIVGARALFRLANLCL